VPGSYNHRYLSELLSLESLSTVACVVSEAWKQFENPEEGERPTLEAQKPLASNGSEDVTVDTSSCVTVL
jgi:hypothetical protein